MDEKCIFKFRYGDDCVDTDRCSQNSGPSRIHSIIKASKSYKDDLHIELENQFQQNENLTVYYHKNCVSRYTSKSNLAKYENPDNDNAPPPSKRLRHSLAPFDFKANCLYCGQECCVDKDPRHPDRWEPAFLCRSTHSEHEQKNYKDFLLEKCDGRNDEWANEVRLRIQGAVSDLHAVEARYHRACMSRFLSNRNFAGHTPAASSSASAECSDDLAFSQVASVMAENKKRIWNSIELFHEYTNYGGCLLNRQCLISELESHFLGELLVLSSQGYAKIATFHKFATYVLKIVKDEDDDDIEKSISKVAKQVVKDCKEFSPDKSLYNTSINEQSANDPVSNTLLKLLASVSPKLDNTLPAILIGNMVTSIVTNQSTDLQIALGVLLRDSKMIVNHMYDYGITCSYDEVLRFKKSAAVAAAQDLNQQGISNSHHGLVQIVADNFDADICSPNGKLSTHSLAMIITQPAKENDTQEHKSIKRISKDEMLEPIGEDENDQIAYRGQLKPVMPQKPETVLDADIKKYQDVSKRRAEETDFQFFHDILFVGNCPEFNGYNTKLCREQGQTSQAKTKVVYLPLIDKPPAEPGTIMVAMLKAKQLSESTGQEYVVFTADQQLYRIAVHILWENPEMFGGNFYLRLGGMHLLMSYVGSIGTLMAESGIVEVLSVPFGGVLKMLTGKKYPQNVRALRMLTEEVLRPLIVAKDPQSFVDLQKCLDDVAAKTRTAKLWVDCLIRPVFTILKYVRAERESDWPLHLETVAEMMPLFFAAGHYNYARYGLYYLRSMQAMPVEVRKHFMDGQHTMHHTTGLFNGIWSDMAIETTFMRYGKGRNGIIGLTLNPGSLKTWAYSLHICNGIVNDLNEMRDETPATHTSHKEEMKARIKTDAKDRKALQDKLQLCIDPLSSDEHPNELVNIVSGKVVAHPSVNVDRAVALGETQMTSFEASWPDGFHNTIPKTVNTMAVSRKHMKMGNEKVYDTEIIYARAMGVQCSGRSLDSNELLSHELAPYPASMFDPNGHMREAKNKASLKNAIKAEIPSRHVDEGIEASFLDGCAVLWVVPWPTAGTIQDYLDNFRGYIRIHLRKSDVYLVFDRYKDGSTKESTRHERDKGASRVYTLRNTTRLPQQKVVLTVTDNKAQLIDLIVQDLLLHKNDFTQHRLIVTGSDDVPLQLYNGTVEKRQDMATTHEEGDTIIVQQVAKVEVGKVLVIADDTDIFVLLLHFSYCGNISCQVIMGSPIHGRAVIDINVTIERNRHIIPNLLPAHGLTGCDTVASYFGIGKGIALKVLKSGRYPLDMLGDINKSLAEVTEQAKKFILACYNQSTCQSLTEARQKVWSRKVALSKACAPKLTSLPPTTEAFEQNVARAHLQVAVWRKTLDPNPPALDPTKYGWTKDDKSLIPVTVPPNVRLAPAELLKLIRCSCASEMPCHTQRCGCCSSNLGCTVFCACQAGPACCNDRTIHENQVADGEDSDDDDHDGDDQDNADDDHENDRN